MTLRNTRLPNLLVDDRIVRLCPACDPAPRPTLGRWTATRPVHACVRCGALGSSGVFVCETVVVARQLFVGTQEEARRALAAGLAAGFPAACVRLTSANHIPQSRDWHLRACPHPEHDLDAFTDPTGRMWQTARRSRQRISTTRAQRRQIAVHGTMTV